jgi:hypothetical protein
MTGTNCDLFTHNQARSYLNHLVFLKFVFVAVLIRIVVTSFTPARFPYLHGFVEYTVGK